MLVPVDINGALVESIVIEGVLVPNIEGVESAGKLVGVAIVVGSALGKSVVLNAEEDIVVLSLLSGTIVDEKSGVMLLLGANVEEIGENIDVVCVGDMVTVLDVPTPDKSEVNGTDETGELSLLNVVDAGMEVSMDN